MNVLNPHRKQQYIPEKVFGKIICGNARNFLNQCQRNGNDANEVYHLASPFYRIILLNHIDTQYPEYATQQIAFRAAVVGFLQELGDYLLNERLHPDHQPLAEKIHSLVKAEEREALQDLRNYWFGKAIGPKRPPLAAYTHHLYGFFFETLAQAAAVWKYEHMSEAIGCYQYYAIWNGVGVTQRLMLEQMDRLWQQHLPFEMYRNYLEGALE